MELKEEGKLKPKSNTKSTTTDTEFSYTDTPLDRIKKERQILKNRSVADEYAEKLGSKLGGRKGKQVGRMLGIDVPTSGSTSSSSSTTATITEEEDDDDEKRKPKLGQLDEEDLEDEYEEDEDVYTETEDERRERMVISSESASSTIDMLRRNVDEDNKDDETDDEMDEEEMLDAVAKALAKTGGIPNRSGSFDIISADDSIDSAETPKQETNESMPNVVSSTVSSGVKTSSVGGSWSPPKEGEKTEDSYQPKVGTWGAFPRPRNISVAYGGGKRVGAGVKTDREKQQQSIESTKERLRAYRQKMGIDVQSEKDNEAVIDEALQLASRAMQRGSYSIGVSALEKVTQYCSTKSVKGGKVFLELAMAYEAEGQTDKAIGLYAALSKSPIDEIKGNADKLLYGLEALNFMKDEAKLKDFSRKKAAETFIDATGFNDITANFDKVYNTAYIDLDKGGQYYRMLTENAVRSTREARQILLAAVDSGEQPRMKIIQAIKSFTRHFDECLEEEKKNEAAKIVPVDYAGRPIVNTRRKSSARSELENLNNAIGMDGYVLSSSSQMLENLNGDNLIELPLNKTSKTSYPIGCPVWYDRLKQTGVEEFSCGDVSSVFVDFSNGKRYYRITKTIDDDNISLSSGNGDLVREDKLMYAAKCPVFVERKDDDNNGEKKEVQGDIIRPHVDKKGTTYTVMLFETGNKIVIVDGVVSEHIKFRNTTNQEGNTNSKEVSKKVNWTPPNLKGSNSNSMSTRDQPLIYSDGELDEPHISKVPANRQRRQRRRPPRRSRSPPANGINGRYRGFPQPSMRGGFPQVGGRGYPIILKSRPKPDGCTCLHVDNLCDKVDEDSIKKFFLRAGVGVIAFRRPYSNRHNDGSMAPLCV